MCRYQFCAVTNISLNEDQTICLATNIERRHFRARARRLWNSVGRRVSSVGAELDARSAGGPEEGVESRHASTEASVQADFSGQKQCRDRVRRRRRCLANAAVHG
jgi:hypothetical protein